VEPADGGLVVVFPDASVRLDAELAVFDALDELKGAGLRTLFRGPRASRVCDELQGERGDPIPALVANERLRAFVELSAKGGVQLRVGKPWEGVLVEGGARA
jgi:hypothetical protein